MLFRHDTPLPLNRHIIIIIYYATEAAHITLYEYTT